MSEETQRLRYPEIAPAGVAAMRGVEHYLNVESGLETVLLELVRLRCSVLNGCDYCVRMHSAELGKHNEPQSRIDEVESMQAMDVFTLRERAALTWAGEITDIQTGHACRESFEAVSEHFSPGEVVNLTMAIASINAWNRMAIAFRPQWHGKRAPDATDADDGSKVSEDD